MRSAKAGKATVERIQRMEAAMERVAAAHAQLSGAISAYRQVQSDLAELKAYYSSAAWKRDFQADKAGKLPDDLKRGVLSEDGLWNLLEADQECFARFAGLPEDPADEA